MFILVIGAGAVGSVLLHLLARDENVSHVRCGTLGAAIIAQSWPKQEKVSFVELDCRDKQALIEAARGCDIVINASSPVFNRPIMEACLAVGAHYQDLCMDVDAPETLDDQLSMDAAFKEAGLVALMCTGVSPGVTNVIAADAVRQLDIAERLLIYHYEHEVSTRFVPSWSTAILLDQVSAEPWIWRNGWLARVPALSEPETLDIQGMGRRAVVYLTVGDEPITLSRFLKVGEIVHKIGGPSLENARVLKHFGLFSDAPGATPGCSLSLRQFIMSAMPPVPSLEDYARLVADGVLKEGRLVSTIVATGEAGGQAAQIRRTVVYPELREVQRAMPGATFIAYPTAFAALVFTGLLSEMPSGAYCPEVLGYELRKRVLDGIQAYGAEIITW